MTTSTTTVGPNVTVDGGYGLVAGGETRTFATELEARAARVRAGGGQVFRL